MATSTSDKHLINDIPDGQLAQILIEHRTPTRRCAAAVVGHRDFQLQQGSRPQVTSVVSVKQRVHSHVRRPHLHELDGTRRLNAGFATYDYVGLNELNRIHARRFGGVSPVARGRVEGERDGHQQVASNLPATSYSADTVLLGVRLQR